MCVSRRYNSCDEFIPDRGWMEMSGNVCWGMGAAATIPCVNCGGEQQWHLVPYYEDVFLDDADGSDNWS